MEMVWHLLCVVCGFGAQHICQSLQFKWNSISSKQIIKTRNAPEISAIARIQGRQTQTLTRSPIVLISEFQIHIYNWFVYFQLLVFFISNLFNNNCCLTLKRQTISNIWFRSEICSSLSLISSILYEMNCNFLNEMRHLFVYL